MLTTTLNYTQLQTALLRLGKAVDSNPVVPITRHIHFLPGKAVTTNFNTTIVAEMSCCTCEFLLPYRELLAISGLLIADLHVTISSTSITLTSGSKVWKMGVPVDTKEFPAIPDMGEEAFAVTTDFWQHFRKAEDSTWTPVDGEQEYVLNNTCIEGNGENIWVMGSNKRYCYTGQVAGEWTGRVLLDNRLTRALHGLDVATIRISESHFIAVGAAQTVFIRRAEYNYYNLRSILGAHPANWVVDRDLLVDELSSLCIYGDVAPIITFTFRDNKLLLHYTGGASEQSADTVIDCCAYAGKTLHVNGKDMMRLLRLLPPGEVSICFGEPEKAIFIQTQIADDAPGGNEQYNVAHDESGRRDAWIYNCLIMPVVKK